MGAVGAASVVTHGFSADESAVLQQFADTIALTADRARLQASERERRGWLSYIADAGDLLAGSLDQDMTMAITGQIVVPRIAQWCAIHLADEREASSCSSRSGTRTSNGTSSCGRSSRRSMATTS